MKVSLNPTSLRYWLSLLLLIALPATTLAQAGSQPLLWKATSATNVVWLYGTIHVGNKAFYPLHPNVEEAFDRARVVALEADPTNQSDLADALARAGYRPPDRIDNHISPDLVRDLRAALPGLGLPLEAARMMKPYLLSMALSMRELSKMGYDAQYGLEVHFAQRTLRHGKKLLELESMRGQLELFDALAPDMQEAMLRSTLDAIRSGSLRRDLTDLIAAWRAGDEAGLMEMIERDSRDLPAAVRDEYRRIFYDRRNEAMAARIAAFLESSRDAHFVAVGAGHLPGDSGIIALLRNKGFAVSRVK